MYSEGTTVFLSKLAVTEDKCYCVLFLLTKGVNVNAYHWWRLSLCQNTLLCSNCHLLVWGRRSGFPSPLAKGRFGCKTLSIHTRCKTDLFWKDFQKTVFDSLAQIHDLFLCCWTTMLAKINLSRKKGHGRSSGCCSLVELLQEKVFRKEKQTFHLRRLTEAVWNSIIHSCFVFHEQVRESFVVNRG